MSLANGHSNGQVATLEPPAMATKPVTPSGLITTAEGTTLTHEQWLLERDKDFGQGASDLATIAGLSGSVVKHWYRKKGLIERDQTESEQMRWGKILEPHILARYQEESGKAIVATQVFLRHPDHPWLFVTLDAICLEGDIVEAKALSNWGNDKEDGFGFDPANPPAKWIYQAQQGMAVTGEDRYTFAVFYGPELSYKECVVERDEALWAQLFTLSCDFRQSLIDSKPPVEFVADDAALMSKLYRGQADGPALELSDAKLLEAAKAYVLHGDLDDREKAKGKAKAALLQALGTSTKATINGYTIVRKATAKQTRLEVLPPAAGPAC
jgi:predicted phage-related endonuclease